jgi:quercetin dioxygenase-like cupin family protein
MMSRRAKIALVGVVIAGIGAAAAYAALPSTNVDPRSFTCSAEQPTPGTGLGTCTLVGATSVNVLSVDAFTRAINQAHGTNAVLQRVHFGSGHSTGWHTHPGPNIVMVVSGGLTLTDDHCNTTHYGPGQGFATGLDVHEAIADNNSEGTDFYSLNILPQDADVLRTDAAPPGCASK